MADVPRRELTITSGQDAAEFVRVSVADTGPGVSCNVADQLFQPFITTKRTGMGRGPFNLTHHYRVTWRTDLV
jgi:two-component system sensor kinase FixL